MIFIVLSVLLTIFGIALIICAFREFFDGVYTVMGRIVSAGLMVILIFFIFALWVLGIYGIQSFCEYQFRYTTCVEDKIETIVSLDKSPSINGRFILGSGSINGQSQYTFFVEKGTNQYLRSNLPASETLVQEHENMKCPNVSYERSYYDVPWWSTSECKLEPFKDHNYVLNVPTGTIIRAIEL
ncbi:MAG: hypothetical protein WC119_00285 [Synergistaceae bacterium]